MLAGFQEPLPYELVITDVDGVLTDGCYQYTKKGKVSKVFGPHDSDGLKMFQRFGIPVVAISADKRGFPISKRRMNDAGVPIFLVSELDRTNWVQSFSKGKKYAFIGDGYHDIESIINADVGYAPISAPTLVKAHANKVIPVCGGNGVILHVFEHFLSIANPENHNLFLNGKL